MKEMNTYLERRMNETVYQSSDIMKAFAPWDKRSLLGWGLFFKYAEKGLNFVLVIC